MDELSQFLQALQGGNDQEKSLGFGGLGGESPWSRFFNNRAPPTDGMMGEPPHMTPPQTSPTPMSAPTGMAPGVMGGGTPMPAPTGMSAPGQMMGGTPMQAPTMGQMQPGPFGRAN
jgi:hypothetical protein